MTRWLAVFAFVLPAASARAQTTVTVEAGAVSQTEKAVAHGSGYLYPATLAETFAGRTQTTGQTAVMRLFGDTIRFWGGSSFFRSGNRVYQLASPVAILNGSLHLPEQFFIQWLPSRFRDSVEYRGGVVRRRGAAVVTAAAPPATSTRAGSSARPPEVAPATGSDQPIGRPTGVPSGAKRIVIIDPGHGGVDPGSSGPNGLKEKDAALLISNRLAALLRTRGYEVHLTRTRDTLISLADRPRFANRWKGDEPGALYISIHLNALKSSSGRGFETFFLSEAGTDDERRVAEMENAAIKYEDGPSVHSGELDQVLNGLRNDFYLRASNDLAAVVQQRLAAFHPGPNRGVKRARFVVLVGALMPAVLVEVGFITNPTEERLLGSASFQDKLAFGIAESVDRFFRENEHLWVRSP
ncbi:MAG TPA: N-acetylmuramoyl-L-alanine amidase [Longimicrobiales bacterium]